MNGIFISFEGADGAGKSTQARLLAEKLRANGHVVTLTREPGGSPGAEEIRKLLVEGDPARWSAETEILLFNAARRDHVERTIKPALEAGHIVISDRFADSTRVYQGVARAELRPMVDKLHALMIGTEPDLTLVVDLDAPTGLSRGLARQSGEDRFEDLGAAFQTRLRAGFRALVGEFPNRAKLVDGAGSPEDVAARIWPHVAAML